MVTAEATLWMGTRRHADRGNRAGQMDWQVQRSGDRAEVGLRLLGDANEHLRQLPGLLGPLIATCRALKGCRVREQPTLAGMTTLRPYTVPAGGPPLTCARAVAQTGLLHDRVTD
jgi:hypothetical protein